MNSKQRARTRFVFICALIAAAALVSSLYSTAIIHGPLYAAKAQNQYARPASALFDRGTIYFSDKDGVKTPAAAKKTGFYVYINPKLIKSAADAYAALSNYIAIDKASFMAKAAKPNDSHEELLHHVDQAVALPIQNLGLSGVGVAPEVWRTYPGGALAAHEIGLVGEDTASSTVSGRYGLERSYNNVLSRPDQADSMNIFADLFSGFGSSAIGGEGGTGDIVMTIEPSVEMYLSKILGETNTAWHPDSVGGIIMDPSTGAVIAMDSLPAFDPNDTSDVKDVSVFSDPLVEHVYEMGSIMKPLTMAAALDKGVITLDSTYDDPGCMTLDTKKICNFDAHAYGVTSMQDILSKSLNMGAATVALKLGAADFASYFTSFGLPAKTGVDLPNEATPLTASLKHSKDIDVATASYGQGIAFSPIGMARALSVIANGGYLITPHLVKEIDYLDGSTKEVAPARTGSVLKADTVAEIKKMLVTVVDTALAKGAIKRDHYTVAAKTGTAEMADHVNGGYYKDRYLHSFFGFFPAYNPKFIVFLYQTYPKGAQYASETLTKPFDELTTFLLNYYNIPPDR